MTEYICPNCRGGFPSGPLDGCCPWCGQPLDGEYEPPTVHSISKVVNDSSGGMETMSERLKDMFKTHNE